MKEEYAKSIGKSAQALSQSEKAQAVYLGIMQETEHMIGNAAKYSKELGGVLAENQAKTKKLAQAFGSALAPAIEEITKAFVKGKSALTEFISENQGATAGLITTAGTFVSLSLVLKGAIKLFGVLKKVMAGASLANPITLAITAISGLVGALISGITKSKQLKKEQEELNEEVSKFKELLDSDTNDFNIEMKISGLEKLEKARKDYIKFAETAKESFKNGIPIDNDGSVDFYSKAFKKTKEEAEELRATFTKAGVDMKNFTLNGKQLDINLKRIDETIKILKQDTENFSLKENFNINIENISKSIDLVDNLAKTYEILAKNESLSGAELSKLASQYPTIAEYIAKTNDLTLERGKIIKEVMQSEIESQRKLMQVEQERIALSITNTQKEIQAKQELLKGQRNNEYEKTSKEIANLKARLEEYTFQNIQAKSSLEVLNSEMKSLEIGELLSGYGSLQSELKNLESAYKTLSQGEQLEYETLANLIDTYPQLQGYIKQTSDVTFKSGNVILDVINSVKQAHTDKRDSLIADTKAQIIAIREETKQVLKAYEEQRLGAIELAKIRKILTQSGREVTIGPVDPSSMINKLKQINEEKVRSLEESIAKIEAVGNIANKVNTDVSKGLNSSTSSIKNQTSELENQIKVYNELQSTAELSLKEQLSMLEKIKVNYAKNASEMQTIDSLIYSKRKELNKEWYDSEIRAIQALNKGREDNTDFANIIAKYKDMINKIQEIYKAYPETLKTLTSELNDYILEATDARIEKVNNLEKESLSKNLESIENHINLLKQLNGLKIGNTELSFTAEDETNLIKKSLDNITVYLNEFIAKKGDNLKFLSDSDKTYLL